MLYTMELRRKAADALKKWKQRKNHRPLIIEGLRQVGKSYVALSFAKANYDDVVFFDFRHDKSLEDVFQNPRRRMEKWHLQKRLQQGIAPIPSIAYINWLVAISLSVIITILCHNMLFCSYWSKRKRKLKQI